MINELYMLFDRVSQSYVSLIYQFKNIDVAKRTFPIILNNPQFDLAPFIEDLQVFKLGTLDLTTGKIEAKNEFIANCVDLIKKDVKKGE